MFGMIEFRASGRTRGGKVSVLLLVPSMGGLLARSGLALLCLSSSSTKVVLVPGTYLDDKS